MSLESAVSSLVTRLESIASRLEQVEHKLANAPTGGSSSVSSGPASAGVTNASVNEFDDLVAEHIKQYVDLSKKLNGEHVGRQAAIVEQAVGALRNLLLNAANSKKPDTEVLKKIFTPVAQAQDSITKISEEKGVHTSQWYNHTAAVAGGIAAFNWVFAEPTPAPFVGEMRASGQFYSNKILKEFRGKDQGQVDWVNAWDGFLKGLQDYVKKHHTTGISWNPKGGDAISFSGTSAGAAPPSGPAKPPPKLPPPSTDAPTSAKSIHQPPPTAALFSELNKGDAITSGLKKVTNDMKTKNRKAEDKVSIVKGADEKVAIEKEIKGQKTGTPKLALEGNKWAIEWQVNNKSIELTETEPRQTVYISKCTGSVVQIKGKINTIMIDDCKKVGVVFDNAISSVEVVNSRGVDVQCTGRVPNFAIDKSSQVVIYISKQGLDAEIITSKSDAMNIVIPAPKDGDDPLELPVPEQFKTIIKNGKLVTEAVQHV